MVGMTNGELTGTGRMKGARRTVALGALLLSAALAQTAPAPVNPAPINPAPINPAPVSPVPVAPVPVAPVPVVPAPTAPAPTAPAPTTPAPSNPAPSSLTPTAPIESTPDQAALPALTLETALARLPQTSSWQQADVVYAAAQQQVAAAQAALGLTFGVGGNYNYSDSFGGAGLNGAGAVGGRTTAAVSATVGLSVLPWSPVYDNLRAARRSLELAGATRAATRATLVLNVYSQYDAARLAQLDLVTAGGQRDLAAAQLQIVRAQRAQNNATAEAVLTAQASLQSAEATLAQTRGTLDANRRTLFSALGLPLREVNFSSAPPESLTLPALDPLLTAAQASRSEVAAASYDVQAAQDQLDIALRNRNLPAANLAVQYGQLGGAGTQAGTSVSGNLNIQTGVASATFSQPLTGNAGNLPTSVALSVSATFNILDPVAQAQIQNARTQVERYQLSLTLARQNVELDVRQKYLAAANAQATLGAARTGVTRAQTALATAQAALTAGTATEVTVQSAQLDLATARRTIESSLENAQLTLLTLRAAAGQPLITTTSGGTP